MMPRSRFWHRAAAVLLGTAAGLLTLGVGGPAAAHAELVGTDPQDGTVLDASPEEMTLTFNEPVRMPDGGTDLLADDGTTVDATAVAVDDTVVITPGEALADGTYVVNWRVVSLDGHPIAGAFSFSVGAPSSVDPAAYSPEPHIGLTALHAIDQAVVYLGTFLIAGLVVFELLILRVTPGSLPVLRYRIQRVRATSLILAGLAIVAAVPLTAAWQSGSDPSALTGSAAWATGIASDTAVAGAIGLVGLVTASLAAPRTGRASRSGRSIWPAALALGGSGIALGALLLVGHTRTFGPGWLVLTADALHVVAGAVWLGGVVGLIPTLMSSVGVDPRRAGITVARFSTLGAWLVLALALSGLALGWRILGTVEALLSTDYGRILLVKVGIAFCVVAIAAWNRYLLVPAVTRDEPGADTGVPAAVARRRLRWTVFAEATLLGLVLGATGVLVSNSPVAAAPDAETAPQAVEVTEELGGGSVQARIAPGQAGENSLEITLLDASGDPLEPAEAPELSTLLAEPEIGPFTQSFTETGPGTYEATIDFTIPGSWTLTVSVRTSKYENPTVDIPVEVAP